MRVVIEGEEQGVRREYVSDETLAIAPLYKSTKGGDPLAYAEGDKVRVFTELGEDFPAHVLSRTTDQTVLRRLGWKNVPVVDRPDEHKGAGLYEWWGPAKGESRGSLWSASTRTFRDAGGFPRVGGGRVVDWDPQDEPLHQFNPPLRGGVPVEDEYDFGEDEPVDDMHLMEEGLVELGESVGGPETWSQSASGLYLPGPESPEAGANPRRSRKFLPDSLREKFEDLEREAEDAGVVLYDFIFNRKGQVAIQTYDPALVSGENVAEGLRTSHFFPSVRRAAEGLLAKLRRGVGESRRSPMGFRSPVPRDEGIIPYEPKSGPREAPNYKTPHPYRGFASPPSYTPRGATQGSGYDAPVSYSGVGYSTWGVSDEFVQHEDTVIEFDEYPDGTAQL